MPEAAGGLSKPSVAPLPSAASTAPLCMHTTTYNLSYQLMRGSMSSLGMLATLGRKPVGKKASGRDEQVDG